MSSRRKPDAGQDSVFFGSIDRAGSHCWLWNGSLNAQGYGIYGPARAALGTRLAHRIHWLIAFGPIEPGLVLDHLCHVRHYVRLSHLEPVTRAQNTLRGFSPPAVNARKIVGKCGHRLTEVVTRSCLVCRAARHRSSRKPSALELLSSGTAPRGTALSPLELLAQKWGHRPALSLEDSLPSRGATQECINSSSH